MKKLAVIILAAGKGVRMKSDLPKVFHKLVGKPLLQHVLEVVKKLDPEKVCVVVGYQKELITDYFKDWGLDFVVQAEQLGTGHAVMQAKDCLKDFDGTVLVLAGDVPLLSEQSLKKLVEFHKKHNAAVTDLTAELPDAGNYGRIIRKPSGELIKIVEKKDASAEELKIKEFNSGTFCFDKKALFEALAEVKAENVQQEYYLTDTVEICKNKNLPVYAFKINNASEVLGVNTKDQLADLAKLISS